MYFAYIGFDAVSTAEDRKDPQRMPRGILGSLASALIYAIVGLVATGLLPTAEGRGPLLARWWARLGEAIVAFGAVVS